MSDENEKLDVGFPKKWKNKLPPGFEETAESMDTEELKTKVIGYQKDLSQTEKDMDVDVKLNDAKEKVKELSKVYRDTMNELKAMTKYALYVLESRGQ